MFRWESAREECVVPSLDGMSKRFPGVPPSGTPVVAGGGVASSTIPGHASVGADLLSDSDSVLSTTHTGRGPSALIGPGDILK